MERFPWPLPLPGRDVRLALVNPARKKFRTAAWMGAAGIFCMALGPVTGDRGVYGAMVALCGGALFVMACFLLTVGLRHAFRRDLVLVIDGEGVTVPRILNYLAGTRSATWAQIQGTSLRTREGVFTGIVEAGRARLTIGQDLLPEGWDVTELMWRIQVRMQLARLDRKPDPLQAAGVEALGIYGPTAEAAVVASDADGPNIVDLVKGPDEYLAQLSSYPQGHKVLVRSVATAAWKERAPQSVVELSTPIPPRVT